MFAQIHRELLLNYSSIFEWNYKLAFKHSKFEKNKTESLGNQKNQIIIKEEN